MKNVSLLLIIYAAFCSFFYSPMAISSSSSYLELEWPQLMPSDDFAALRNPPESMFDIPEGAPNDNIDFIDQLNTTDEAAKRYVEALKSNRVITKYNNQRIRIPGFIVPLENDDERRVTTFFVVPYFGACIHLPPPPPNQIIYGTVEKGVEIAGLNEPFYFEGTLIIDNTKHSLGSSAYTMLVDKVEPF